MYISSFNMTSPPGSHPQLPHPSPSGNLMPSSPLNPQPSPMTAHSPGPNLAYMQSHPDSSPFAAMSPAAANWPGSPRPSPRPGQSPEHKLQPQGIHILDAISIITFHHDQTKFGIQFTAILLRCFYFGQANSQFSSLSSV